MGFNKLSQAPHISVIKQVGGSDRPPCIASSYRTDSISSGDAYSKRNECGLTVLIQTVNYCVSDVLSVHLPHLTVRIHLILGQALILQVLSGLDTNGERPYTHGKNNPIELD